MILVGIQKSKNAKFISKARESPLGVFIFTTVGRIHIYIQLQKYFKKRKHLIYEILKFKN